MLCRNQSTPRSLIYPLKVVDYHHPIHYRWQGHSHMSPMFCSSPKQHESSWRKLAIRKEASHIHSAVVPSAKSVAKQKNKQQLEGLRRLKVLARAPLARLRWDLRSVCQSSSTRKSQAFMHMSVFEKDEWKHLACVNQSVLLTLMFRSASECSWFPPLSSPPPPNMRFHNLMTGPASHCRHFSQALSGSSSTTPPATLPIVFQHAVVALWHLFRSLHRETLTILTTFCCSALLSEQRSLKRVSFVVCENGLRG